VRDRTGTGRCSSTARGRGSIRPTIVSPQRHSPPYPSSPFSLLLLARAELSSLRCRLQYAGHTPSLSDSLRDSLPHLILLHLPRQLLHQFRPFPDRNRLRPGRLPLKSVGAPSRMPTNLLRPSSARAELTVSTVPPPSSSPALFLHCPSRRRGRLTATAPPVTGCLRAALHRARAPHGCAIHEHYSSGSI
jgi:hypothetical protein